MFKFVVYAIQPPFYQLPTHVVPAHAKARLQTLMAHIDAVDRAKNFKVMLAELGFLKYIATRHKGDWRFYTEDGDHEV